MADVFISYASEDRNRVRPLAEALQARGFNVWWDRALGAGQDYASVIERELRGAKAVIVVWTQSSAASTFVRDEAGRARDEGRLIPVLLDPVQIPLGFGSFQAEDFTRWNGGTNAPQMQILEEALKAKLEGRDIDGGAVARKRRKLMARVRIVSLLTVVALVVAIAAGLNNIFNEPEPQPDLRAQLLRLLEEGALTPEQAIQLAQLLQSGALGETQLAENQQPSSSDEAPAAAAPLSTSRSGGAADSGIGNAVVSEAAFTAAATETFTESTSVLFRHPDARVRMAALQMSNPETRDAGIQALWAIAQEPGVDPATRQAIYEACGAVGETNDHPLAQRALENAAELDPANVRVWRMYSRSLRRTNQTDEAAAAALVSEATEAQAQGQTEVAEQNLAQALPMLRGDNARAYVASNLGEIAEQRQDYAAASARYDYALRLREQAVQSNPEAAPAVQQSLAEDATRLVRSLDRSGRTREACVRAQQVQSEHEVEVDAALAERCETQFRVQVRTDVLQRAPVQREPAETAPVEQRQLQQRTAPQLQQRAVTPAQP